MTQRLGIRKSLDELEKEAWAPKPSMLETPAVMTGLDADRKVVIKDTENRVSLNGIWQMVWDGGREGETGSIGALEGQYSGQCAVQCTYGPL